MQIGEAIIAGSIINLIGFIIIMHFRDNAWFKKQTWKMNAANTRAINKLNIRKLEKQIGLTSTPEVKTKGGILNSIPDLVNLAKENPELIELLTENLGGGADTGIIGTLASIVEENPEIIKGITQGLGKKEDDNIPVGER